MCMLTLIFLFAFFKCNRYESKSLRRKRSYAYIKNILIRLFLVKVRVRVTGIIKTWFLEAFLITQDAILIISRKNHYSNPKNCWAETHLNKVCLNEYYIRSGEFFFEINNKTKAWPNMEKSQRSNVYWLFHHCNILFDMIHYDVLY